jgi:hypothetical protein
VSYGKQITMFYFLFWLEFQDDHQGRTKFNIGPNGKIF